MTTTRGLRRLTVLLAGLSLVGTTACSQLPDHGTVHTESEDGRASVPDAPYFRPPGPTPGADQQSIVRGFLTAMEANPFSVAAARSFLAPDAAQQWRPNGGTVVYQAARYQGAGTRVQVQLSEAHSLDRRGSWRAGPSGRQTLDFSLVRVRGQWRISDPPNRLVVGESYFSSQFLPYHLYFFDRSGRVLVPDVVYLPRGQQTATSLVRGLLTGPERDRVAAVRTALPATDLDLGVVITDGGTAEIPLGPEMLRLSPEQVSRSMHQLARTLREVPGVERVRVTVDGAPLPLPDGRTELSVDEGSEYAVTGLGASHELVAVRKGRVVSISDGKATPVQGALGRRGYLLRSLALTRSGSTVAGVSENGTRVYVAPTSAAGRVRTVFAGGTDLAQPGYDLFGRLWLLDRTSAGAVVHVITGRQDRVVRVPGVSGHAISTVRLSPDGTRLAVAFGAGTRLRAGVATVLRDSDGKVRRVLPVRSVPVADAEPDHRLGRALDIGWRTASTLAVLTAAVEGVSRVVQVPYDGSPGAEVTVRPEAFTGRAIELAVNADAALPMELLDSRGILHRLDASGRWVAQPGAAQLSSAAYAD